MPPQLLSLRLRSLIIPASLIFLKIIFSNDNLMATKINNCPFQIAMTDVLTWLKLAFHLARKIRQKMNFQVHYRWLLKDAEGVVTHRPR